MNFKYSAALVAMMVVATSPASAEEDCRLQIAASLPMTLEAAGRPVIPASINGNPIHLLVDTGAPGAALQESLALKLGLGYDIAKRWERHRIFGGVSMYRYTTVKDFTLGNLKASDISFMLIPDEQRMIEGADGLLGARVLFFYDVDFDFANAKMNLFAPHRCPGRVVYWTQDENAIAKIPMEMDDGHIRIDVEIEGKKINATMDTGASSSVMDLEEFMPEFGLTPQSPGMVEYHASDDPNPRYRYTFKTLHLQGVTVQNARVTFISQKYSKARDYRMLLGMDILRELHLFIAYKEKMLYATGATQN